VGYGASLQNADLVGTDSFEEILEILQEHHEKSQGEWILGRGWDQNDWEVKEWPTREKLDELFPDVPVMIRRIDGHAALVNGEAIRRAGLTPSSEIEGGDIVLKNGELSGILVDNATSLVGRMVPDPGKEEIKQSILIAQANCYAVGLTSVHDAGVGAETIDLIDELNRSGQLGIRIYAMLSPGTKNFEAYMYRGIHKTDHLNVRSVKLFADGALGSRGALMLEPYSDDAGNYGLQVASTEYLEKICRDAYDHGYQVNTHCIGDAANRLMLDIYGAILKEKNDHRWRIEHSQIIHQDDFDKFGLYSIIPSVQTTHGTSDMYWADERVGTERMNGAYAYRQLLMQNGWLPNGSDFPVEQINPLYGFYAAVARKDLEGWPEKGFQKEEALTREEAMKAMTIWAAMSAFEENEKGSLEEGKFADFIVTEEDLMSAPEDKIPHIRIRYTYLGGKLVYSADGH